MHSRKFRLQFMQYGEIRLIGLITYDKHLVRNCLNQALESVRKT